MKMTQQTLEFTLWARLKKSGKLCDEWAASFCQFYNHLGDIPDRHKLGRLNNKKKYAPGNVRWDRSAQGGARAV